jgi:hypothetical protein
MADQTTLSIGVQFVADSASISKINRETDKLRISLEKRLRGMGVDWGKVAKSAIAATSEINAISDSAAVFTKKLSAATISSVSHLKKLGDQLEQAKREAEELAAAFDAADAGAQEGIAKQMGEAAIAVRNLTQSIDLERIARHKEVKELEKVVKIQKKYQDRVKEAIKSDSGDIFEGVKNKISGGSLKGLLGDLGGGIKKSIMGGIARRGEAKAASASLAAGGGEAGMAASAAELAKAGKMLGAAGLALGAAVAGFAAFIALVKAASDHMTGLNKALVDGVGIANDMVGSAGDYKSVMDGLRNSAIDAHYSMLKFGKSSEDALKIVNAYAKTSTGSLAQTSNTLKQLGGDKGLQMFAQNAIVYGKALAMEGTEVASMMGDFQSEIGYGAKNITGLMDNIVTSAATANMPLSKFMNIFRQVTPDVDLFSNRMEQLTGIIKMLSKNMSPGMVKKFMDEFSKGLKGTSFKDRLRMMFTAGGPGVVGNILKKDFAKTARSIGAQFDEFGEGFGTKFQDAAKGGEGAMTKFLATAAAAAAKQGKQLSGAQREAAMRLAFSESQRQKGGPTHTATAMKGASTWAAYQISRKQSSFGGTKLGEGINEQVLENLGWSQAKIDLMKVIEQSAAQNQEELRRFGKTSSRSTNEELRKLIAIQKYGNASAESLAKVTYDDMKKADEDLIFEAAEASNQEKDSATKMMDLATQQATATMSVGDKLENIIGFLLEKIYNVLQPLLDIIDDIWSWLTGSEDQKKMITEMQSWRDDTVKGYEGTAAAIREKAEKTGEMAAESKDPKEKERLLKEQEALQQKAAEQSALAEEMKMFGEKVQEAVKGGATGGDLVRQTIDYKTLSDNWSDVAKMIEGSDTWKGAQARLSSDERDAFKRARNSTSLAGAGSEDVKLIQNILGRDRDMANVMTLGRMKVAKGPSKEAAAKAGYKGATRRPGSKDAKTYLSEEERKRAEEASDVENLVDLTPEQMKGSVRIGGAENFKDRLNSTGVDTVKTKDQLGAAGVSVGATTGATGEQFAKIAEASKTTSETSASNLEKSDSMVGLLTAIKAATESINVQSMGVSMHLGDIKQFMKGPGIHLEKSKWKNNSVEAMRSMFDEVLEEELTMFLFSLIQFMDEEGKANRQLVLGDPGARAKLIGKGGGISTLAGGQFTDLATRPGLLPNPLKLGGGAPTKDFGGEIPVTGIYRLQKGETVTRRGESSGKSTTVSATINVNGANDPHLVAAIVRNEIYKLSEKH